MPIQLLSPFMVSEMTRQFRPPTTVMASNVGLMTPDFTPQDTVTTSGYLPPYQIVKHITVKPIVLGQSYTISPPTFKSHHSSDDNNPHNPTTNAFAHFTPETVHPIPPLTTTPHHHATTLFTTYWTSVPILRCLSNHRAHPSITALLSALHTLHCIGYSLTRSLSIHSLRSRRPPTPTFIHNPAATNLLAPSPDWEVAFDTWLLKQAEMAQAAQHDFAAFLAAKEEVDLAIKACIVDVFGEKSRGGRVKQGGIEWSVFWFDGWWKSKANVFVGILGELVGRVVDAEILGTGGRAEDGDLEAQGIIGKREEVGGRGGEDREVDGQIEDIVRLYSYTDPADQDEVKHTSSADGPRISDELLQTIEHELNVLAQQEQRQHQHEDPHGCRNDDNIDLKNEDNAKDIDAEGEPDNEYLHSLSTHDIPNLLQLQEQDDDLAADIQQAKRRKLMQHDMEEHQGGRSEVIEVPILIDASIFSQMGRRMDMDVDVDVVENGFGKAAGSVLDDPFVEALDEIVNLDEGDDGFEAVREAGEKEERKDKGKGKARSIGSSRVWWK